MIVFYRLRSKKLNNIRFDRRHLARFFYQKVVVEADKRELRVKKSAPNDNVKIGYYSIFLLSNDRKRSYESIGIVIYWYRSIVKKWLTPLQKVARFKLKLHGLTVQQLSVFFIFLFFSHRTSDCQTVGRRKRKQWWAGFFQAAARGYY